MSLGVNRLRRGPRAAVSTDLLRPVHACVASPPVVTRRTILSRDARQRHEAEPYGTRAPRVSRRKHGGFTGAARRRFLRVGVIPAVDHPPLSISYNRPDLGCQTAVLRHPAVGRCPLGARGTALTAVSRPNPQTMILSARRSTAGQSGFRKPLLKTLETPA